MYVKEWRGSVVGAILAVSFTSVLTELDSERILLK